MENSEIRLGRSKVTIADVHASLDDSKITEKLQEISEKLDSKPIFPEIHVEPNHHIHVAPSAVPDIIMPEYPDQLVKIVIPTEHFASISCHLEKISRMMPIAILLIAIGLAAHVVLLITFNTDIKEILSWVKHLESTH